MQLANEEELRDVPFAIYINMENNKGELIPKHVQNISLNPIFLVKNLTTI